MLKKLLLFFVVLVAPMVSVAGVYGDTNKNIDASLYDDSITQNALTKIPLPNNLSAKVKMLYSSAQTERKQGNIKEAIKLYRKVLDEQPDFVSARFELALCYIDDEQWYRADYYLRLALGAEHLPDDVRQIMEQYRYLVRQNKNSDFWFEFGDVPDMRASLADSNSGCFGNGKSGVCEQLTESKDESGVNLAAGADYEFKLSENWRWKNEGAFYTNLYKKKSYDDLYLTGSTGPRYVWDRGDVWLAGMVGRAWYGTERFGWSYGAKIDANYDWTRKFSSGLILIFANNVYDKYDDLLNGQSYTAIPNFTYAIDSTKYILLRGELERETAKYDPYSNYKYGFAFGFGVEMPNGILVYLEPYFSWINYDGAVDFIKNSVPMHIKERYFLQKYTLSVSDVKVEYMGFIPVVNITYTKKDSNIPIPSYDRWSFGLNIKRKF